MYLDPGRILVLLPFVFLVSQHQTPPHLPFRPACKIGFDTCEWYRVVKRTRVYRWRTIGMIFRLHCEYLSTLNCPSADSNWNGSPQLYLSKGILECRNRVQRHVTPRCRQSRWWWLQADDDICIMTAFYLCVVPLLADNWHPYRTIWTPSGSLADTSKPKLAWSSCGEFYNNRVAGEASWSTVIRAKD